MRYADDMVLIVTTPKGLENLMKADKNYREQTAFEVEGGSMVIDMCRCKGEAVVMIEAEERQV